MSINIKRKRKQLLITILRQQNGNILTEQQTINSIQSFLNNHIKLQQNIFSIFQSAYSKFVNNISKSYWNNFLFATIYLKLYSNTYQIIIGNTINTSKLINDFSRIIYRNF